MRLAIFGLLVLVLPCGSAHAGEWLVCTLVNGGCMYPTTQTPFTEEALCQTAAQALAQQKQVRTRCALRVWRIQWHSVPRPIPPGRTETIPTPRGRVGVLNERGEATIQRTEQTTWVFDTEAECREQLRRMQPPRSDVPRAECMWEMPD